MPGDYNNSWFPNYAQGTPGLPIQNQMVNPYTGGSYQIVYPAPYTGQSMDTWVRTPGTTPQNAADYVTKSEFDALKSELQSLRQILEELTKSGVWGSDDHANDY